MKLLLRALIVIWSMMAVILVLLSFLAPVEYIKEPAQGEVCPVKCQDQGLGNWTGDMDSCRCVCAEGWIFSH